MRRVLDDAEMPMLFATLMLGASLLYNDRWLAAFTALLLYIAMLAMFYMRRPDSWAIDGREPAASGEGCADGELTEQHRASLESARDASTNLRDNRVRNAI